MHSMHIVNAYTYHLASFPDSEWNEVDLSPSLIPRFRME